MIVQGPATSSATPSATPTANAALKAAAQRFEAVFVRQMIATMRQARFGDDIFGSGATDSFREMADANTADAIARQGVFGVANLLERQLGGPK